MLDLCPRASANAAVDVRPHLPMKPLKGFHFAVDCGPFPRPQRLGMQSLAAKPAKAAAMHLKLRLGIAKLLQSSQMAFLFGPGLAGGKTLRPWCLGGAPPAQSPHNRLVRALIHLSPCLQLALK